MRNRIITCSGTKIMHCNQCNTKFNIEEIIDNCNVSWPAKSWTQFQCPKCNCMKHLELQNGSIKVGYVDGAPGPCFITEERFQNSNLKIACDISNGIYVQISGYKKMIAKK